MTNSKQGLALASLGNRGPNRNTNNFYISDGAYNGYGGYNNYRGRG